MDKATGTSTRVVRCMRCAALVRTALLPGDTFECPRCKRRYTMSRTQVQREEGPKKAEPDATVAAAAPVAAPDPGPAEVSSAASSGATQAIDPSLIAVADARSSGATQAIDPRQLELATPPPSPPVPGAPGTGTYGAVHPTAGPMPAAPGAPYDPNALALEQQRLDLERQRLELERERMELEQRKAQGEEPAAGGPTAPRAKTKDLKTTSARLRAAGTARRLTKATGRHRAARRASSSGRLAAAAPGEPAAEGAAPASAPEATDDAASDRTTSSRRTTRERAAAGDEREKTTVFLVLMICGMVLAAIIGLVLSSGGGNDRDGSGARRREGDRRRSEPSAPSGAARPGVPTVADVTGRPSSEPEASSERPAAGATPAGADDDGPRVEEGRARPAAGAPDAEPTDDEAAEAAARAERERQRLIGEILRARQLVSNRSMSVQDLTEANSILALVTLDPHWDESLRAEVTAAYEQLASARTARASRLREHALALAQKEKWVEVIAIVENIEALGVDVPLDVAKLRELGRRVVAARATGGEPGAQPAEGKPVSVATVAGRIERLRGRLADGAITQQQYQLELVALRRELVGRPVAAYGELLEAREDERDPTRVVALVQVGDVWVRVDCPRRSWQVLRELRKGSIVRLDGRLDDWDLARRTIQLVVAGEVTRG